MNVVLVVAIVLLALVGHGYVWMGAVNRIHAWAGPRLLVDLATLLCEVAFVTLPVLVAWHWSPVESNDFLAKIFTERGVLPRYGLFCGVWGAIKTALALFGPKVADHPRVLLDHQTERLDFSDQLGSQPLRGWYPRLLGAVPGNQVLQLGIDRKRIAVARLHPEHEGLKIAHISDLHMTGRLCEKYFVLAMEQVQLQRPDVVVITGDLVEKESCLPWLANSLGQLRARFGVYFVLGNHDAFIDAERTRQMLVDLGLTPVANRCHSAEWNGAPIELVGNERPWFPCDVTFTPTDLHQSNRPPLRVALVHTPDQFGWAQREGADLVFAGHTHGGQVCLPVLGAVASPSLHGTKYAGGVFRSGNTTMHVTRGMSGKTPIRWNCLPEIAMLELVRG